MSTIKVGENESIDSALRRFKRKCSRDGILGDLRRKEHAFRAEKEEVGSGTQKKQQELNTKACY